MGSFSFLEIVTIAVVILIIFGPDRLPEFAKRIGQLVAKARTLTRQFTNEISGEFSDTVEPLKTAKDDIDGIKGDLKAAGATFVGYTEMPASESEPRIDPDEVDTGEMEIADRDVESE